MSNYQDPTDVIRQQARTFLDVLTGEICGLSAAASHMDYDGQNPGGPFASALGCPPPGLLIRLKQSLVPSLQHQGG